METEFIRNLQLMILFVKNFLTFLDDHLHLLRQTILEMLLELIPQLVTQQIFHLVIELILLLTTCFGEFELFFFLLLLKLGSHSLHLLQTFDKLLNLL